MTKKRFISFILAAILILYCACTVITFTASQKYLENDFSDFQAELDAFMEDYKAYSSPEELILYISLSFQNRYPIVAKAYKDNKLVAESASYICFYNDDAQRNEVINIEEYLTDEIKGQINSFFKKSDLIESVCVDNFQYANINGKIIPVSISLFDWNDRQNTLEIKLSDSPADYVVEGRNDEPGAEFYFYDTNIKSYKHYSYTGLEKLAEEFIKEPNAFSNNDFDRNICVKNEIINFNDELYTLYISAMYNPLNDTISTDIFKTELLIQSVLFAVAGIAIIIASCRIFDRNLKTEESKQAFTNAAAHELKTPLSVIQSQCECIIENIAPEKNPQYINSIYSESLRMNKLVSTLLQYSRLVSANKVLKEKCSLSEIVFAEADRYKSLINSKNIILKTNIINDAITVCNKELISLVADNYLSNAVKHTPENKNITVTLSKEKSGYKFSVFNEGKEINQKYKENLWDIFYRDDKVRNSSDNSTGMGLAICKQILELHKFKYGFENKNNGVEFYFITK